MKYTEKDKNANLICAKAADELLTINNITLISFFLFISGCDIINLGDA